MKNRHEVAKRLDKVMDDWRKVNEEFRKTPLNDYIFHRLKELEVEVYTLRWVLEEI